jgi:methyl-accepting chemotaxis protein
MRTRNCLAVLPILVLLFLASGNASAGTDGSLPSGKRLVIPAWKWSASADDGAALPGFDDSAWAEVPAGGKLGPVEPGTTFWLRARLPSSDVAGLLPGSGDSLYFLTGMAGCVFDAYANGSLIGSHGRTSPRYDIRRTHSEAFLVEGGLLSGDGSLVLALRCSYLGTTLVLPPYALGDGAAAAYETGDRNFWNGEFYTMLAALCAFLGFYFLALFAGKRQALDNLWFGVSLVLLAFYFYEMGARFLPWGGPVLSALARASLPASIIFLYRFFSRFFAFKEHRALDIAAMILAFAFYPAFLAVRNDEAVSTLVFNLGLLPIALTLVFGIVAAISAVRRRRVEAIPLLVGMFFGSYFAVHDIYYQALGKVPFAWLQGLTFFFLDAAIFVMLSMRQALLSRQLEELAGELEQGKNELESSLHRLVEAGEAVAEIGRELGSAVGSVAASTEISARRSSGVGEEAERLASSAEEADALVTDFLASIGRVNARLAEEAAGIQRTATAAGQLQAGIKSSATSIDRTSEFADSLAGLTTDGQRAADALAGAMDRIAESARGIGEVVDAVNEFAERTNLLAMNASIEAAHAGQAGKGFGVIAGEVKKLAAAQGERATRISSLARDIGKRLAEAAGDADLVRASLRRIAEDAKDASLRMQEAKASAGEQAAASLEVREAMESLSGSVAAIRDEAENQAGYSEAVRKAVGAMVAGAEGARGSAAAIAREGAEIARAVRDLRALADRSLSLTEDLKRGSRRA